MFPLIHAKFILNFLETYLYLLPVLVQLFLYMKKNYIDKKN